VIIVAAVSAGGWLHQRKMAKKFNVALARLAFDRHRL